MHVQCSKVVFTEKNGNTLTAVDGDLIYIPKDTEYVVQFFSPAGEVADLLVNFNVFDTSGNEYTFADGITRILSSTPKSISDRMCTIGEHSVHMDSPHLSVTEVFYALLSRILSFHSTETQDDPKKKAIAKAISYIDNHLNENTAITELAKMCLMSETAFRKLFRDITGLSPAKYKIQKKIQKAQSILTNSPEVSVSEVAYMLGFCDVSYFYKVFANITGTTPNKLRYK
jgi:AraC-like DNA-binding protein